MKKSSGGVIILCAMALSVMEVEFIVVVECSQGQGSGLEESDNITYT
jgi:hypothetical protein